MRILITAPVLALGLLALAGCSTTSAGRDMTLAERAVQCHGSARLVPTGRETGDVRRDYMCRSVHAPRDSNVTGNGTARSRAIDRIYMGRRN